MARQRAHLIIHGRVQGVFFRSSARQKAQALGLSGWVRNQPDGSVEAEVEGEEEAVQRFVAWAHQGPAGAVVERVDVQPEAAQNEAGAFRIVG